MQSNEEADRIDIADYFWVVYRRKWIVVFVTLIFFGVGVFQNLTEVPIYKASSQILIDKENLNLVKIEELYNQETNDAFFQTQYKILESTFIAERVIKQLKLDQNPYFNPSLKVSEDGTQAKAPSLGSMANQFVKNIKIVPVKKTRLVRIEYEFQDPKVAAQIADAIAVEYVKFSVDSHKGMIQGAADILGQKIKEQRKQLEDSEKILQEYKDKHNIVGLESEQSSNITKQSEMKLLLIEAKRVLELETAKYKKVKDSNLHNYNFDAEHDILSNAYLLKLKQEYANLKGEQEDLSKVYGAKHPKISALNKKIEGVQKSIVEEKKRFIASLYQFKLKSHDKVKQIEDDLEKLKSEAKRLSEHAVNYGVLQRDFEFNQQHFDMLLKRYKEAGVSTGFNNINIQIIGTAVVPKVPVRPMIVDNIVTALAIGFIVGVILVFFLEHLDSSIKSVDDLKQFLKIPYLGTVPSFKSEITDKNESPFIASRYRKSVISEAYRSIRTTVLFSAGKNEQKTLLITSANVSEGKTVTSCNLATTIAQFDTKTLLIDADLRKPQLHKIFKLPNEKGLSNLLVESASLEEVVFPTEISNLSVIPCGVIPPNPSELIGSQRMQDLIEELKGKYDKIIFDSSPIMPVTDSAILKNYVDGVLLVVMVGKTSRDAIHQVVDTLQGESENLIGAILNNVKFGRGKGYMYYQYYYGGENPSQKIVS